MMKFYPSEIKNDIYDIMDEYLAGSDLYEEDLIDVICKFFEDNNIEFQYEVAIWPDCYGGSCAFAWIENGHPQMEMFDWRRNP